MTVAYGKSLGACAGEVRSINHVTGGDISWSQRPSSSRRCIKATDTPGSASTQDLIREFSAGAVATVLRTVSLLSS